ncbi:hypothetical protein PM082_005614 [Marasmius tenuissimus]|nr:hypothetical protein PM082_005614 [Marasmius tenuissimus]
MDPPTSSTGAAENPSYPHPQGPPPQDPMDGVNLLELTFTSTILSYIKTRLSVVFPWLLLQGIANSAIPTTTTPDSRYHPTNILTRYLLLKKPTRLTQMTNRDLFVPRSDEA